MYKVKSTIKKLDTVTIVSLGIIVCVGVYLYLVIFTRYMPALPSLPKISAPQVNWEAYKIKMPSAPPKKEVKSAKVEDPAVAQHKEMMNTASKQIKLPQSEVPTVATVSDKTKLDNQEFFKEAENGDKVLMYPKQKKAYLYRPSIKRVLAEAELQYIASESAQPDQKSVTKKQLVSPDKPSGKILVQPD